MPETLKVQHTASGATLYALLRDSAGLVWNGTTFVAYATANLATYALTMTEQGTASRFYVGDMPTVASGTYSVTAYVRAGATPAETDAPVAVGQVTWTGTAFLVGSTANQVSDALLDRTDAVESALTLRQALRLVVAATAGKLSGAATTTVVVRNVGDTKARITATVDADGNRSAVTTDVT